MRSLLHVLPFLLCVFFVVDGAFAQKANYWNKIKKNIHHTPVENIPTKYYDSVPGERIVDEGPRDILSKLPDGSFIYRQFAEGTLQLITYSTHPSRHTDYRHGAYRTWWHTGQPKSEGQYQNDLAVGYWLHFDPAGQLLREGEMWNDRREGTWNFYHSGGRLYCSRNYAAGEPVGDVIYYDTTGAISPEPIIPTEPIADPDEMPYMLSCYDVVRDERDSCHHHTLLYYIYKNIKYPASARENGIEGTAEIQVVIEADGTLGDISAVSSPSEDIATECIRVIASSPRWVPGLMDGVAVPTKIVLPIRFKLE